MYRIAHSAPAQCGPSSASRQASIALSDDQRAHRQVRHDAVRVRLVLHRPLRRHRRALRPRGQREDALRGRRVVQPAEADERLRPHAGRLVGQRRDERLGVEAVQLRLAVGQRPQGELADGGVSGELEQRRVRVLAVELLQREDRRDAAFQRRRRVGRQLRPAPSSSRRSGRGAGFRPGRAAA